MWAPYPRQALRSDGFRREIAYLWRAHERKCYIDLEDLKNVQVTVHFLMHNQLIDIEWSTGIQLLRI